MTLKKGDFIEIEFTGKLKDGEIFDSNIKEDSGKTASWSQPSHRNKTIYSLYWRTYVS